MVRDCQTICLFKKNSKPRKVVVFFVVVRFTGDLESVEERGGFLRRGENREWWLKLDMWWLLAPLVVPPHTHWAGCHHGALPRCTLDTNTAWEEHKYNIRRKQIHYQDNTNTVWWKQYNTNTPTYTAWLLWDAVIGWGLLSCAPCGFMDLSLYSLAAAFHCVPLYFSPAVCVFVWLAEKTFYCEVFTAVQIFLHSAYFSSALCLDAYMACLSSKSK